MYTTKAAGVKMSKPQCPNCNSINILYCPMVEEYWTIEAIHEDGALDLGDNIDSVTTSEHRFECADCMESFDSVREIRMVEPEEDGLRDLFERQKEVIKRLIKRWA